MSKIYDFVVVGGGPSGSVTSWLLSKQGFQVVQIERQKELSRKVCGEYLSPLGVDILNDLGLLEEMKEFPKVFGMKIVSPAGKIVKTDFPSSETSLGYGLSVNRKSFDTKLLEKSTSSGTELKLGVAVRSFSKTSSGWKIQLSDNSILYARFLIGADGRNGIVAKELGLKIEDSVKKVALHCFIDKKTDNERYGEMHILEGGYIGLDPTGKREMNFSLVCNADEIIKNNGKRECFNAFIKKSPLLLNEFGLLGRDVEINAVTPITNSVKSLLISGAALIGDAAGFIDPLTGEGMTNSLWMAKEFAARVKEKQSTLFDFDNASIDFLKMKERNFKQKSILNKLFQVIIKYPIICELIAKFLQGSKLRGDTFIGIIGNIYTPLRGFKKMITKG
ncbi:MAG: FAD-dependent monooxygenase [Bacteriovoracaceae bacterium]|nr:FAD-dependent monooxygenase [Bacteriovoracaceae bacterium]